MKEAKLVEDEEGGDEDESWRNHDWGEDGMLVPPSISPDPVIQKLDPRRKGSVKYFTNSCTSFNLGPAAICKAMCNCIL